MLTLDQLKLIMPHLNGSRAQMMFPHLLQALVDGNINTRLRQAAFLAQIAHESAELRYMEEIASGAQYEGRKDLGNTQPGDGKRYKGRSPLQLTGRNNYSACGKDLGVNLVNHPELAATPEVGFRVTVWFWTKHNLNALADTGDFDKVTKIINGGTNGAAQRQAFYKTALSVIQ